MEGAGTSSRVVPQADDAAPAAIAGIRRNTRDNAGSRAAGNAHGGPAILVTVTLKALPDAEGNRASSASSQTSDRKGNMAP